MSENAPGTGWFDQATAADQARSAELEAVTQKILFSRVMFLVGVTCAFTALGAFIGRDLSPGTGIIFWLVALGMILASGFIKKQSGALGMSLLFAVGLVLFIVMGQDKKGSNEAQSVRITSSALIKKDGTEEPKVVLAIYEDFQCPHCRDFEKTFGPTLNKLVETGAAAVDYNLVAILNATNKGFSTRAANAAYCVADENKEAFVRFHSALFAQQPVEGSGTGPDNAALIETARQAGAAGGVPACINSGRYNDMVKGLAAAAKVTATPGTAASASSSVVVAEPPLQ